MTSKNDQGVQGTTGAGRLRCEHCGVLLPASCPDDEGHGCPSWEAFKEAEAARGKQS